MCIRDRVNTYPFLSDDKAQMFKPEREALGSCPRCGSPVYEGKKNYYCITFVTAYTKCDYYADEMMQYLQQSRDCLLYTSRCV